MLALGGVFIAIILIVSLLWNFCAGDSQDTPAQQEGKPSPDGKREIVVSEVRPGLILIRGSPTTEETLRIIQDYDSIQNGTGANDSYEATTNPHLPFGNHAYDQNTTISSNDNQLLDFNLDKRPPPYAPSY